MSALAFSGPVLQVAAGFMQAQGQIQQGEGQARAYEFNANVAEENARTAEMVAAQDERQYRIQARQRLGEMRAQYGASGVNMTGSPMEVMAESAANAEMDALNIKYMGKVKATNFRNEAALNRYSAGQARSAGYMGAASSLLSSFAGAASKIPMGK